MIISHKHKFIFIHCRKVAGSSFKVAFAPFIGDRDIVIGSWNEILRSGVPLNKAAVRCLWQPRPLIFYVMGRLARKTHGESINIAIKSFYARGLSNNPPHPTAQEAEDYFFDAWKSYKKFAFVRNPFERLASDYFWRLRATGKQATFAQYLKLLEKKDCRNGFVHPGGVSNWEMIAKGQDIIVDHIGRYEKLDEDIKTICDTLNLPILRLNTNEKANKCNNCYARLYQKGEIEAVKRICANELGAFGYQFPYD